MMTEHWLSIAAGVFLVGMMLYGHYRGLLRQCVSLGALVLTIITVKVATPYVTDFVKANPVIRENRRHIFEFAALLCFIRRAKAFFRRPSVWRSKN